jgi:type IX secretion system PorP/SprF family membrane protein
LDGSLCGKASFLVRNRYSFLFGFFLLYGAALYAQSGPHFSLYMLDRYQFNPAFGGLEASLSITGNYRSQWLGIEGNPVQKYVSGHMPFYLWKGALGFQIMHESIGAQKQLQATVSYNYVHEAEFGLISAGFAAGITQQTLDGTILRTPDGDYEGPVILHHDPLLPNIVINGIAPVFHGGVYFAGNTFEAGLSVTGFTPVDVELEGLRIRDKEVIHGFAEYFIESLPEINLYPSVYVQSDLVQTQVGISVRAEYRDFMTFGAGLRGYSGNTLDAVMLIGGLRLSDHMRLYYSYDVGLSSLSKATEGSHELMLRYNLNKVIGAGLPPPVIYSPRF